MEKTTNKIKTTTSYQLSRKTAAVVREAQAEPILVTKAGEPIVIICSVEHYKEILNHEKN